MAAMRSSLPAVALLAAAFLLSARQVFVPPPSASAQSPLVQLRGASSVAAGAAAAAAPLAAVAEDTLVDYNMAGEFTQFFVVGYFGLTTAFTVFAFLSYLILTKLKII
uniref:Uncharacterized protein n=1 Tax=Alexandrium monilatum TaxID=311494 RepID=A0A7S4RFQ4_9DINO|mmetsp:Transcript_38165/g.118720  ORF Transcript_38165/g.118720 Transcript_38165/m.118720 type:complete len:108 (+) Transcript_38165:74-397(+)